MPENNRIYAIDAGSSQEAFAIDFIPNSGNEAEQLYNQIVEDFTDKWINVMLNDIESFSKTRQISDIQYASSTDEGYHKSPHVCKVEISVSEVLTNYAV